MTVARKLFEATRAANVPDEKVYVDALVMTIATNTEAGRDHARYDSRGARRVPHAHISLGLSNVSFGLPCDRWSTARS